MKTVAALVTMAIMLLAPPATPEPPALSDQEVQFRWAAEPGQRFEFELADEMRFTKPLIVRRVEHPLNARLEQRDDRQDRRALDDDVEEIALPGQPFFRDQKMARRTDGKEFGDALDERQHDDL